MKFDPRTATPAEFEAEARRTHAEVVARLDALTPEERRAWDEFAMPGYERRLRKLQFNNISSIEGLEKNIADCLMHYRRNQEQSSPEYARRRDQQIAQDRERARAEREREAREEAQRRNAA